MWIDSHCHLDSPEFSPSLDDTVSAANRVGVRKIILPSVSSLGFTEVARLALRYSACFYALGIHPYYVEKSSEVDLKMLRNCVESALSDEKFVAIGEIGLDFFLPTLKSEPLRSRQIFFFQEQLRIAHDFNLPVLLHMRCAQDENLKWLRRIRPKAGIAHAFNGSLQQANNFIDLGFKLGVGGAMTFNRATRIRELVAKLPLDTLVLETDAPDIAPAWLKPRCNSPEQIPAIGAVLANLRNIQVVEVAQATTINAQTVLTRLPRA